MNFEFSDEQNMLREQAQNFLQDQCQLTEVRKVLEDKSLLYHEGLWKGIADLGWMAAGIPEQYGGLGLGALELCVLAEELGRSIAPTPFSSSVYLVTYALLKFGTDEQKQSYLPKLATGELIGAFAYAEGAQSPSVDNIQTSVDGVGAVTGTKLPVADGDVADFAITVAKDDAAGGLTLVLVDLNGTERTTLSTVDPTRSHASITFNAASGTKMQDAGNGNTQIESLFDSAAVLFAFEQVGGADACLQMAREYALERYAFGRPIASFQAIKHKLADMYIELTLARSNCYYGAWALSTAAAELPIAAATARLSAGKAYYECSKENIQTHGGMGFTWEFNCHLYYRRAKLLALNLGNEVVWQNRLLNSLEHSNQRAT